ncbi:MAG: hypothetical protein ABL957_11415 [Parvularculaceae bacterium]
MQDAPTQAQAAATVELGEGASAVWEPKSSGLLIVFSGFATRYRPWEAFHFMGLTRKYAVNRLFLRDPKQAWYHQGIDGVSSCVDETAAFIAGVIAERGIDKTAAIGVSAGGYASLIHGWLLEIDEIHAIAPQSYIDIENRLANDDFFMEEQVANIYETDFAQPEYFDLKPLFDSTPDIRTKMHIHYCRNHRLDSLHALRLEGSPGVSMHDYEEGGHRLAPKMTKDGVIDTIIEKAFDIQPDASFTDGAGKRARRAAAAARTDAALSE